MGRVWLALTALAVFGGNASAQAPGDPLAPMTKFICGVANTLAGPLGLAIGFLVLMGGGVALAVSGRRAFGTISWGAIGTVVLVSGAAIFAALFGKSAGC
jgi:hypothetical protein